MKKICSVIVCLLLAVSLVACGGSPASSQASVPDSAPAASQAGASSVSVAALDDSAGDDATIQEQVLLDAEGVKVTATALDPVGDWGPEIKVLVENNGERAVTVQVRNCSINGYMVEPTFSCDVAPGKKSNAAVSFMASDMERSGIETIGNVELTFHVVDTETYDTVFDSDVVVIETSAAGSVAAASGPAGEALFDQDGVRITFAGFDDADLFGAGFWFYIENSTDTPITVQARDSSINGFMVEGTMSADVMPGKVRYSSLSFFDTDLQDNGVESVDDLELKFHIFHTDTFDTIMDSEAIAITP